MKSTTWKCGLALLLAAVLFLPILPVRAEGAFLTEKGTELEPSGEEPFFDENNGNGDAAEVSVSGNDLTGGQSAEEMTVKREGVQAGAVAEGASALCISSLSDPNAEIQVKDGIIYSTRTVMLDSYHSSTYELLLTNTGTEAIEQLSVELESDTVELNETPGDLGTLPGSGDFIGYQTASGGSQETPAADDELKNQVKVSLTAKEGVDAGTDISGILTIRSAGEILAVLTLTGMVGDPSITTLEIPETVMYVPYGVKLQNSNSYDWNKVYYMLDSGTLPIGMRVKSNGEIYGVPKENGEFTFTVCMYNSYAEFDVSSRTYTLVVKDNTDENVDMSTDMGYELSQRVQDIGLDSLLSASSNSNVIPNQMLVSQGAYDEFVDVYLDGVKLVEGQDYQSESGSTRITVRSSTLISFGVGTHTLGVEFRTGVTNTLKRAAQNFQVSLIDREPEAAQEEDNNDETVEQVGEVVAEKLFYTVIKGDNMSRIARKAGISLAQLLVLNPQIKNPNLIFPGQVLLVGYTQGNAAAVALNLEGAVYDEVKKGDCLYKIARRNNVTLKTIIDLNPEIAKQKYIYPGQKVRVK